MAVPPQAGSAPNRYFRDFDFQYDADMPVSLAFALLGQKMGWRPGSPRWKKEWKTCMNAEYGRLIGSRVSSLKDWQELCAEVGIEEVFPSITKCKKALAKIHVNIVDVLDCWNTPVIPERFMSTQALRDYTKKNKKFFSRKIAKQDKVLRVLLRHLL